MKKLIMRKLIWLLLSVCLPCYGMPEFMAKSPKEGLVEALLYYNVKYPHIVYAQALLETGYFKSRQCKVQNNLFGLYNSSKGRYHSFEHWSESVLAYIKYIQSRHREGEDYYQFLKRINYATDPNYVKKIKIIVQRECGLF